VTGEENSHTAVHAGPKSRPKLSPGAWVLAGAPCPGVYKYSGLALQVGDWATGRQPVTVKQQQQHLKCGLGTVRLSGIDLSGGKLYQMRDEYSSTECGIVYKHTLINVKLHTGKKGKKTELTGGSPLRRRGFALDYSFIY